MVSRVSRSRSMLASRAELPRLGGAPFWAILSRQICTDHSLQYNRRASPESALRLVRTRRIEHALPLGRRSSSSRSGSSEGRLLAQGAIGDDVGLVAVVVGVTQRLLVVKARDERDSRQATLVDALGRLDRLVQSGSL